MTGTDIQILKEAYHQINPSKSLPQIIKVTEIYDGGPHSGSQEVIYHVTNRTENSAHGVATHNPALTCEIDVTEADVELKDGAYHTVANFVWDEATSAYISKPEEESAPDSEIGFTTPNIGRGCVNC